MTIPEITKAIEDDELREFHTDEHRKVVSQAIRARCEVVGVGLKDEVKEKLFRQVGGDKYELIENTGDEKHLAPPTPSSLPPGNHLRAEEASQSPQPEEEGCQPGEGDERRLVERQIRERRGQQAFRDALRKRYQDHCLVTGCEVLAVLEAAHIKPYRKSDDHHPANGLLLRSDIHTLFDVDLLGIEPESLKVELHPGLGKEYESVAGRTLLCDTRTRPSLAALKERYEQFRQRCAQPL
jgi:hypothetical protein